MYELPPIEIIIGVFLLKLLPYVVLENLAWFSNTAKSRFLFICRKKVSKRRRIRTEEESLQLMNKSN
ncbi:UNVERIFIED_CONTAM: hypothetical protein NCL1_24582 [Trichonephila clavipes]